MVSSGAVNGSAPAPPRKAPTRSERKARTRAELLDAAERLFRRDGFHATSVDAIADEAGYTKGAVYSNFGGKEDLFFGVYERHVARRSATIHASIDRSSSAAEALRTGVREAARRTDDGWMAVFFEFWAHVLRHPQHRARFAALHRQALAPIVRGVEALSRERGIEPPLSPDLLAAAHLALGNGLQLDRLTRPEDIDVEAIERATMTLAGATTPLGEGDSE
jgi:AcrR family transcriptional regulator